MLTHPRPADSTVYKLNIHVQLLPHVFLTLSIVGFQAFDPGMALLCTAGVAVGTEFLGYFGENVTIVWVTSYALLDLNVGEILSKGGHMYVYLKRLLTMRLMRISCTFILHFGNVKIHLS